MAADKTTSEACHCSHPDCKAHQGNCKAPGTTPVNISYRGERKGTWRFCGPCEGEWKGFEGIDIQPQTPLLPADVA